MVNQKVKHEREERPQHPLQGHYPSYLLLLTKSSHKICTTSYYCHMGTKFSTQEKGKIYQIQIIILYYILCDILSLEKMPEKQGEYMFRKHFVFVGLFITSGTPPFFL